MAYSTLLKLSSKDMSSEAEVETRLLAKIFNDLGYKEKDIISKKMISVIISK